MPEEYFIKKAVKHEGSYTRHVREVHGRKGFDKKGRIKQEVIDFDIHGAHGEHRAKEASLARTLKRLSAKRFM